MKNTYTNNAMIGPIAIPAVKGILDALALGTAAHGASQSGNPDYKTKFIQNHDYEIQEAYRQALKEVSNKLANRQMTVPIAENTLVLRPEYRTTTIPVDILNTIGYKPVWNAGKNSGDTSQQSDTQTSEIISGGGGNDPENEKDELIKKLREELEQLKKSKNEQPSNKKNPFVEGVQKGWNGLTTVGSTVGSNVLNGIGIGLAGFALPTIVGGGVYYGGKALYDWWSNKEEDKANSTSNDDATSGFGK